MDAYLKLKYRQEIRSGDQIRIYAYYSGGHGVLAGLILEQLFRFQMKRESKRDSRKKTSPIQPTQAVGRLVSLPYGHNLESAAGRGSLSQRPCKSKRPSRLWALNRKSISIWNLAHCKPGMLDYKIQECMPPFS